MTFQLPTKPRKKRIFIAIHSTPEYLKSRGQAIKDSWLQEIDERIATVRFISAPLEGFPTFTLPDVNDYDYPPQKKSFKDRMKKSYIKIIKTVRFLQLFSLLMLFTKKFKKKNSKFIIINFVLLNRKICDLFKKTMLRIVVPKLKHSKWHTFQRAFWIG